MRLHAGLLRAMGADGRADDSAPAAVPVSAAAVDRPGAMALGSRRMRIAVFGSGGVGGYFGGRLARAGHSVAFLARGAHLAALRRDGLRVDSLAGDFTLQPVEATEEPRAVGPVD